MLCVYMCVLIMCVFVVYMHMQVYMCSIQMHTAIHCKYILYCSRQLFTVCYKIIHTYIRMHLMDFCDFMFALLYIIEMVMVKYVSGDGMYLWDISKRR